VTVLLNRVRTQACKEILLGAPTSLKIDVVKKYRIDCALMQCYEKKRKEKLRRQ